MKKFPHKPRGSELKELLVQFQGDYQSRLAKVPDLNTASNLILLERLWSNCLSVAALEYAFDTAMENVKSYWQAACDYAERIIQLGGPSWTNYYRIQLALANLVSRHSLREQLEKIQRPTAVSATAGLDELDFLVAEIMRDISAGREDAARNGLALAEKRSGDRSLPPHIRSSELIPLMNLQLAIVESNIRALNEAVTQNLEAHIRWYSPISHRYVPFGLIDYVGLGLLKLAQQRGLETSVESVYLPKEYL